MTKSEIIKNAIQSYTYSRPLLIDRRRTAIKIAIVNGFTPEFIKSARKIYFLRRKIRNSGANVMSTAQRVEYVKMCVNELIFNQDTATYADGDWKMYHRPSSNGIGWVMIAPDEPGNNYYTEDKIVVQYLRNRFINQITQNTI